MANTKREPMHTSTMVLQLLQKLAQDALPTTRLSPATEQAYRDAEALLRRQEQSNG